MNQVADPSIQVLPAGYSEHDLATILTAGGNFKVLRRFEPVSIYNADDGAQKKIAMIIDTETTGKDYLEDKITEIGYVLAEYNPDNGVVYRVIDAHCSNQDPGFPLSELIVKLTGITDEFLAGKSFDREKIMADLARTHIVIAQNSNFDRRFLEAEFPEFKNKPWACAMAQGPWIDMGISSRGQEFIAMKVCGMFYEAHRAEVDARVLLHILTQGAPEANGPILGYVLDHARQDAYRLWAENRTFDEAGNEKLKKRGYRWSAKDAQAPMIKGVWYHPEVVDLDAELEWLSTNIYNGRVQKLTLDRVSAIDRFSDRFSGREKVDCNPPAASPAPKPKP